MAKRRPRGFSVRDGEGEIRATRGRSKEERPTQSRGGVKGGFPLAGSRDSVPCRVWGNAPTVPRATSMLNALNQGAGSEASLPVTLRSRRSALKLHIRPLTYCRARWARPTSMGNDLFSRCWSFLLQEVSPLRRRVGGFAVAPDTPSQRSPMQLDFYRNISLRICRRNHALPQWICGCLKKGAGKAKWN